MKIALTGLHGQGKTTLLNALKQQKFFEGYVFADSPTRTLSKLYPINEDGTQDTQIGVMVGHYINQLPSKVVLDRCAIDGIVYTNYFQRRGKIDRDLYAAIQHIFSYLIKQYDYIFYLVPELNNMSDGVRSTDVDFFEEIKEEFNYYIAHLPIKIYNLKGSVEDRISTILQTITL